MRVLCPGARRNRSPFDPEWLLADLSIDPARMLQHRSLVTAYGTPQPLAHHVARCLCAPTDDKGRQSQRGTCRQATRPLSSRPLQIAHTHLVEPACSSPRVGTGPGGAGGLRCG
jgi:hypothetical protein